uniref:Uncharacterized protein n=1 Tax=Timema cristinae TaxID=61476 RepID=A0A7R9DNX6_TIMCR|nr:unnamed protein product [Timema cristinae]
MRTVSPYFLTSRTHPLQQTKS